MRDIHTGWGKPVDVSDLEVLSVPKCPYYYYYRGEVSDYNAGQDSTRDHQTCGSLKAVVLGAPQSYHHHMVCHHGGFCTRPMNKGVYYRDYVDSNAYMLVIGQIKFYTWLDRPRR